VTTTPPEPMTAQQIIGDTYAPDQPVDLDEDPDAGDAAAPPAGVEQPDTAGDDTDVEVTTDDEPDDGPGEDGATAPVLETATAQPPNLEYK
jgi:hypothetical protein